MLLSVVYLSESSWFAFSLRFDISFNISLVFAHPCEQNERLRITSFFKQKKEKKIHKMKKNCFLRRLWLVTLEGIIECGSPCEIFSAINIWYLKYFLFKMTCRHSHTPVFGRVHPIKILLSFCVGTKNKINLSWTNFHCY